MRLAMEPLLYSYGVDVVLAGHVHAYERTAAVYQEELDDCGMTYLVLGDGGKGAFG
jgi:acid phosphatase type 7